MLVMPQNTVTNGLQKKPKVKKHNKQVKGFTIVLPAANDPLRVFERRKRWFELSAPKHLPLRFVPVHPDAVRFGEHMQVLHMQRGTSNVPETITWNFEINELQAELLGIWKNRHGVNSVIEPMSVAMMLMLSFTVRLIC